MSRKKIKNPLIKRIPKEIIGDWKKYLVVFLFLVLTIGFVSGMYVANDSMLTSADEGVSKYKQEDGHFELKDKADSELVTAIESGEVKTAPDEKDSDSSKTPVTLYENFYRNETEDYDADGKKDGTIRVYTKTGDINLACLIEGSFPQNENEIAMDRMHADNVGMKVGDTIKVSGKEFKVSGLIAYVNYSTLHEKKTDMMFDAIKFDVAMVTKEGFDRLDKSIHYAYAWKYEDEPADDIEQKEKSDDFLEAMVSQVMATGNEVEDYTPRYSNPAINFATDDMGSDKAMGGVLLDILIVIIAFIFAVTISNMIANESSAIGTLRASGYTKGELIRHYLSMPVIAGMDEPIEWNRLRKAINAKMSSGDFKINEDKLMGPFFLSKKVIASDENGEIIDREKFIKAFMSKVIMYLYEDAVKQGKHRFFDGCPDTGKYSSVCDAFKTMGLAIFGPTFKESFYDKED